MPDKHPIQIAREIQAELDLLFQVLAVTPDSELAGEPVLVSTGKLIALVLRLGAAVRVILKDSGD